MAGAGPRIVIADTSVLVNFLRIDGMVLLGGLSNPIVITEHVEAEVSDHYSDQQARLAAALVDGHVSTTALNAPEELVLFGQLMGDGRLGSGECAAITCAISRQHILAIDDRKAAREAMRIENSLIIFGTAEIMVAMIREGLVTVEQADAIKETWEREHRFRLVFGSFAEML